jgi:hypothetical protein
MCSARLTLEFNHNRPTVASSRAMLPDSVFQINPNWNSNHVASKHSFPHFVFPLRPGRFRQWCLTARTPRRVEVERDGH